MGALWIRALGYNSRHLSGVVSLFWLSLFLVTHFIMACSWNRKLSAWKSHHALPRRVRLWSEDEALCLEVPPYTSFARYKSDHENEPLCLEAPSCASWEGAIFVCIACNTVRSSRWVNMTTRMRRQQNNEKNKR